MSQQRIGYSKKCPKEQCVLPFKAVPLVGNLPPLGRKCANSSFCKDSRVILKASAATSDASETCFDLRFGLSTFFASVLLLVVWLSKSECKVGSAATSVAFNGKLRCCKNDLPCVARGVISVCKGFGDMVLLRTAGREHFFDTRVMEKEQDLAPPPFCKWAQNGILGWIRWKDRLEALEYADNSLWHRFFALGKL